MKYIFLTLLLAGCASSPPRQCYIQTERSDLCYNDEFVGEIHIMEGITHQVCCPLPKMEKPIHEHGRF